MAADTQLVERIGRGEEDALSELYRRYGGRVFRFAFSLTGRLELAEEVVQETFVALWKGARGYAGRASVSTWILGIARNQSFAAIRREEKGARFPPDPPDLPDPQQELEAEACTARVRKAVDELPAQQREVVFLAFYEGLPYQQIARIVGVPEGTVKSRMYHARRRLGEGLL